MFKIYKEKLHTDFNHLWQKPKIRVHYTDEFWYDKQHVGHDPLERYFKYLANDVTLSSDKYTNHSIRATCITLLDNAQFEACHIIAVTGHKSEITIKNYSRKCPNEKKRQTSDALATPILSKIAKAPSPAPQKKQDETQILQQPTFDLNNMELFDFENDNDDDVLINFLNANPDLEKQVQPTMPPQQGSAPACSMVLQPSVQNVQNVQNINPGLPAVIPKMYFQGNNVTIYYNFQSK